MPRVIYTILIAFIGGFIGHNLKFPAGAMVGAMIAVAAANVLGAKLEIPLSFNIAAQILIGGFLGLSVTKEVVTGLKYYVIPSVLVVIILAVFGIVTGFIVSKLTGLELYTSLFGSVPGGMQEMIVLSQSYDVNHPAVMAIQTVRRILIVIIYPLLVILVSKFAGNVTNLPGK